MRMQDIGQRAAPGVKDVPRGWGGSKYAQVDVALNKPCEWGCGRPG